MLTMLEHRVFFFNIHTITMWVHDRLLAPAGLNEKKFMSRTWRKFYEPLYIYIYIHLDLMPALRRGNLWRRWYLQLSSFLSQLSPCSNAGLSSMTANFFQFFCAVDDEMELLSFLQKVLLCKLYCCTFPWSASA